MTGADRPPGTARSGPTSLVLHRRAFALAWRSAPALIVARSVLALVGGLVPVAIAWLTKVVLDGIIAESADLLVPVIALALLGVAASLLPHVIRFLEAELVRRVGLAARSELYDAVVRLPGLRRFEDPSFRDQLQLATEAGPSGPPMILSSGFGLVQAVVQLVGFLATLFAISPWMVLIVAAAAMPTLRAELQLAVARVAMQRSLGHAARREFFYAQLLSSVTAAKEVRLFDLGALFGSRMISELRKINAREREMDRRELRVQALLGAVGAAVAGGGLVWAVTVAREGDLTVGEVSVFVAAVAGVQLALSTMVSTVADSHEAALLFGNHQAVVSAAPDLTLPAQTVEVTPLRHSIELRDVWFRYDDSLPWVLRGVDLTIPAGTSLALVGRNGAGKSTLVKLLCRFYDPTRGQVLWDGTDLRDFDPRDLRARVGAVFQDFVQYELSARENIGLGDTTRLDDDEAIVDAARRAGIHEVLLALPSAYDTMLSRIYMNETDREEHLTGVVLSGGQWQRLALARALFRDRTDLLILDEPSAGMDAEAEHRLRERLDEHRRGRTSVLISHRLGTVKDADTVAVLDGGQIVEQGDHATLIGSGELYASLFELQADGYQAPAPGGASEP